MSKQLIICTHCEGEGSYEKSEYEVDTCPKCEGMRILCEFKFPKIISKIGRGGEAEELYTEILKKIVKFNHL